MDDALRRLVSTRANHRCEYCHLPGSMDALPFQIDHVVPRKHGGDSTPANLAFSCIQCNASKGPNLSGIDPADNTVAELFNPRRQQWDEHFNWEGPLLIGRTPVGRATIAVMRINAHDRVEHRRMLVEIGVEF